MDNAAPLGKDLLGIKELKRDDILQILETASAFKEVLERDIKKVPTLRGKTMVNLFFEPSTRTRMSFELAGKRLSMDVINVSIQLSSVVKGETLLDTIRTMEAYGADIVVIRHSSSGVPHLLAGNVNASVINAGDGFNEHPTQALLDLFTIRRMKGRLEGLEVAIVGDIAHSRVARSNIYAMGKLGMNIRLVGPPTLIPAGIETLPGVKVFHRMEDGLAGADVVMQLRVQKERQDSWFFPTISEYAKLYILNSKRLALAKDDAIVMHPGPINRGIEISSDVADGTRSMILDQVANGLAVRMAVLYLLSGARA
ncbi:MAG: aspartate carbamoyltransferase catalytic subunit [Nitrospirae bacterium]|nr:aspartate carbamoyltransferase catalytic subunit [Nitrospirota bacterium]